MVFKANLSVKSTSIGSLRAAHYFIKVLLLVDSKNLFVGWMRGTQPYAISPLSPPPPKSDKSIIPSIVILQRQAAHREPFCASKMTQFGTSIEDQSVILWFFFYLVSDDGTWRWRKGSLCKLKWCIECASDESECTNSSQQSLNEGEIVVYKCTSHSSNEKCYGTSLSKELTWWSLSKERGSSFKTMIIYSCLSKSSNNT